MYVYNLLPITVLGQMYEVTTYSYVSIITQHAC